MKKKVLACLLSCAMTAALLAGCSGGADTAETENTAAEETTEDAAESTDAAEEETADAETTEGGRKFGYTYWAASDFFSTIGDTLTEEAAKNGDEVIIVDAQQDQATQLSIIEDFITQGVAAVFLNPVDREGIEPALDMLNEAGIPIINIDTAVASLDKVESYVASDNYGAGVQCAEKLIELVPDGGEIAILDYPANSACVDRVTGFTDTLEGSNFTVVAQQDAEGKPDPGLQKTQDILQANPDIVAIQGSASTDVVGAAQAVDELGLTGKVAVIGTSMTSIARNYVEKDVIQTFSVWDPALAGQAMIELAIDVLENGEAPSGLEVEGYENLTAEGTVLYGEARVDVTKDNMDEYDF